MSRYGFYNRITTSSAISVDSISEKDVEFEVAGPPNDSISSLAFSNAGDFLAAGSWNNEVRIYEVNGKLERTTGRSIYSHQGPVLDVTWNKDGNRVISCGVDCAAYMHDVPSGQTMQVAQHDAPIKSVKWFESPHGEIVVTGSWDKTLKYWDTRTPAPIATVSLPERCYSLDVEYPLLVVGTAERHVQMYYLTAPTKPFRTIESPLKWQTRVVTCFPSADGFALGSVEGRVAIHYVDEEIASRCYAFKCHRQEIVAGKRDKLMVYAVNDISFHPIHGTFSTAGSDGGINFWDKDARSRLKEFSHAPGPISATSYNRTGTMFAYAVSYDWSRGYSGLALGHPNKIMVHMCKDEEVMRKPVRGK